MNRREEGQAMVLFGVLLAMILVVGSVLALNLVFLVGQINSIKEAMVEAAAGGAMQGANIPGGAGLDEVKARNTARKLLQWNLQGIPFLAAPAAQLAAEADIRVIEPAGSPEPDPFEPGTSYRTPFVTIRGKFPLQLVWGGVIGVPIHAAAQVGQSP